MFSSDVTELFRPFFRNDDDIDDLYWRIVETVAIHEGLFPVYESIFAFHQLLDFAMFIKNHSICKGWSCLASERLLFYIKQCLSIGGRNPDKTLIDTYGPYEDSKCSSMYVDDDATDQSKNNNNNVSVDEEGNMHFDSYASYMFCKINFKNFFDDEFNRYEMDSLYKTLIYEIKKKRQIISKH
jgi:hypothetical protein